jgi:hypothetical protein
MATPTALAQPITGNGMNQGDLVTLLDNIVNEINDIQTTLANYKTIYDAHTHESPGSSFAASRGSTPDTGAAENSLTASAASAYTDSSGTNLKLTAG